ncbi:2-hydroxyacid dehydrogenase [Spirillospora sp. CA-142024]|uniref:2-hydroxyacid dehydrogenase n=1 Tax=Spirillospora sp. CA-142024 TaxID=3240036 RepID=UPI003D9064BE
MTSVLVIGDRFIPASSYADALAERLGDIPGVEVRTVVWRADKAEQHRLQQVMEVQGAGAVPPPPEVLAAVSDAEIVCLHFAPIGRALLEAAPALRLVAVARAGLENVDVPAATDRGVAVVPVQGRNAGAVAELAIGFMLAEARNIARADASVKSGGWRKDFPGARIEIAGRTIGMVGFGHVGRTLVRRLSGFECHPVVFDPYASDEDLSEHGARRADTLDEVFAEGDFVVVQARHTPETDRFITAKHFALMKPSAYFINVARSRLVDNDALYAALSAGRIAGAGLDVFDEEPLTADSPWRNLDNVTITTHFGGDTEDTNTTSAKLVADAVTEFLRTGKAPGGVNAAELGLT